MFLSLFGPLGTWKFGPGPHSQSVVEIGAPIMTIESIDTWLKAAESNKITTKNAWDAPIIDHFSNVDGFKDVHGINFQKASTTLDGCVKVYSTRVDTVMDGTFKLLGSLGSEETGKDGRKGKKKGGGTLEKNPSTLDMKELKQHSFVEPTFFKDKETSSIFNTSRINSQGLLSLRDERVEEALNLNQYPVNLSGLFSEKHICPMLNEMNPEVTQELFEACFEAEEPSMETPLPEIDHFELEDPSQYDEKSAPGKQEIEVTTFGYVKGWAGPGHWKTSRHRRMNERKAREKHEINFLEDPDEAPLHDFGDTLVSASEIVKRRDVSQTLPEDFMFSPASLYKFLVREGSFFQKHDEEVELEKKVNEMSICEASVHPIQQEVENEAPEEIETDLKNVSNVNMSRSLLLKYRRKPKRIDIAKLQDNILRSVNSHKSTSLKSVCREVPMMYEAKDSENISVHYCILSMLFLAQEKNLKIDNSGQDLLLKSVK